MQVGKSFAITRPHTAGESPLLRIQYLNMRKGSEISRRSIHSLLTRRTAEAVFIKQKRSNACLDSNLCLKIAKDAAQNRSRSVPWLSFNLEALLFLVSKIVSMAALLNTQTRARISSVFVSYARFPAATNF